MVTLLSEKKIKKVWNGVDPPQVMENSILFFFFETFPYLFSLFLFYFR